MTLPAHDTIHLIKFQFSFETPFWNFCFEKDIERSLAEISDMFFLPRYTMTNIDFDYERTLTMIEGILPEGYYLIAQYIVHKVTQPFIPEKYLTAILRL